MAMTRAEMDRRMDEHFRFEATDNIEGVLKTLALDVEHDVVGWPTGPAHGRDAAKPFYDALFADLADGKVECLRRLYGGDFLVDESLWKGRAPADRSAWRAGTGRWRSACCMSSSSPAPATSRREQVWLDHRPRSCPAAAAGLSRWTSTPARGAPISARRTRKDLLQAAARLLRLGRHDRAWRRSPKRRWSRAPPPIATSRRSMPCCWKPRSTSPCPEAGTLLVRDDAPKDDARRPGRTGGFDASARDDRWPTRRSCGRMLDAFAATQAATAMARATLPARQEPPHAADRRGTGAGRAASSGQRR